MPFEAELEAIRRQRGEGANPNPWARELEAIQSMRAGGPGVPPPEPPGRSFVAEGGRWGDERLPIRGGRLPPLEAPDAPIQSDPATDRVATLREGVAPEPVQTPGPRDVMRMGAVAAGQFIEGLPIVGGPLKAGVEQAAAATRSAFGGGTREEELAAIRSRQAAAEAEHPGLATASHVAGSLTGYGSLVKAAPEAFGLAAGSRWTQAGLGGLSAGAIEFVDKLARGSDMDAAINGGLRAGLTGAILTPLFVKWAQGVETRAGRQPVVEEMERRAQQLYQQAEQSGIGIGARAANRFLGEAEQVVRAGSFSNNSIPQVLRTAMAQLEAEAASGIAIPMSRFELMRRELTGFIRTKTEPEVQRRLVGQIVDKLDDFMANPGIISVRQAGVAMSPAEQQGLLRQARETWRQMSNVNRIDRALANAETHSSGLANGIRSEFAKLVKDKKFMRGLSEEEARVVREVGSMANFARPINILAKMDPRRSNLRLMSVFGIGLGTAGGGAVGGMTVLGLGMMGTNIANRAMVQRAMVPRRVLGGETNIPRMETLRRAGATAAQALAGAR